MIIKQAKNDIEKHTSENIVKKHTDDNFLIPSRLKSLQN